MRLKISTTIFCCCLFFFYENSFAQDQPCSLVGLIGQNPATAFPVCGTGAYYQDTVPECGGDAMIGFCTGQGITSVNPYWYKFTCYSSGTLVFLISPINISDDYDWQLFDVTNKDPNSVFTDASTFVCCNWSGVTGNTGTSLNAADASECESVGPVPSTTPPPFSKAPNIVKGHNYLLLLSHFVQFAPSEKGYNLIFGGGSAVITDTTPPRLLSATASCDDASATINLNKNMQCKTVAADGSDFVLSPSVANIVSASGVNCTAGFDMNAVNITFDKPLPVGNYYVIMKKGSDANTLLDNCDTPVPVDDSIPLTILPKMPTPLDSIAPIGCSPDTLRLVFGRNIQCGSIAPDGTDFTVTGPVAVVVKAAVGENCMNGLSPVIDVILASPIVKGGTYKITLNNGSDGNTITDECAEETPAGSVLKFAGYDTVSAAFSYKISLSCKSDSVQYFTTGKTSITQWTWVFNGNDTTHAQSPVEIYKNFLTAKTVFVTTSNGVCTDTASAVINLDNFIQANFTEPSFVCPNDLANFKDTSVGNITSWYWSFGDGTTFTSATAQNPPPHKYAVSATNADVLLPVELVVGNDLNCYDTAINYIKVLYNCYIAVPSAFTPNGDGLNDYLYPLNAYKAQDLDFRVYNRYGQLIFHTKNWQRKWDGTINGQKQGSGTYVWMLSYTDGDTGKPVFQKGTSVLIR